MSDMVNQLSGILYRDAQRRQARAMRRHQAEIGRLMRSLAWSAVLAAVIWVAVLWVGM